jgi:hypothetical protein
MTSLTYTETLEGWKRYQVIVGLRVVVLVTAIAKPMPFRSYGVIGAAVLESPEEMVASAVGKWSLRADGRWE